MRLNREQREALLKKAHSILEVRAAKKLRDQALKKALAPGWRALQNALAAEKAAKKAKEKAEKALNRELRRRSGLPAAAVDENGALNANLENYWEFRRNNENRLILASIEAETLDQLLELLVGKE